MNSNERLAPDNSSYQHSLSSQAEKSATANHRQIITNLNSFISDQHWNASASLLQMNRQTFQRALHWVDLYKIQMPSIGCILELGVHYGATLATLINLRGIYEPYNISRRIIGIDTFCGFAQVCTEDNAGDRQLWREGDYAVAANSYEDILDNILSYHESNCPCGHIKKFQVIKGDAPVALRKHLEENRHELYSMVVFDMDVYKPTLECLELIKERCSANTIVVFDELNCKSFPGETIALLELSCLSKVELHSVPGNPFTAWALAKDIFA